MCPDCFADLNSPHGRFGHIAGCITGCQHLAVGKLNRVFVGVDLGDDKAAILVKLVRLNKKVFAFFESLDDAFDAIALSNLDLKAGHRCLLGNLDGFQIEVGIGAC